MTTAVCPGCTIHPEVSKPLEEPTLGKVVLSLPTIHCAACISKIEKALMLRDDVDQARVNLSQKRVYVSGDAEPHILSEVLRAVGFEAFPLNEADLTPIEDQMGRSLLIRLGVAGFAMMNVMLLSVAVWSGATEATRQLFHLISALIALPAIVYAAEPFYMSAWSALRVRQLNMDVPITLAIFLTAGLSTYESFFGGHHAYFDAAISLTFFLLIGRYLDHRTRRFAQSAASELTALEVSTAERKTGSGYQTVSFNMLGVGDTVLVSSGSRVPVDGLVTTDSVSLMTDCSFLTGESEPVIRHVGDSVHAGEINIGAPFEIRATAVGEKTSLRQMSAAVALAEASKSRYTSLADRAALLYAPLVHILALATFVIWYIGTSDVRTSLNVANAVLIITCPCALGLAVPAVSITAIGRLFSMGYLVKDGTALERISEIDTVIFDKTGTLTIPKAHINDEDFQPHERGILASLAAQSKHPISTAIAETLNGTPLCKLENVQDHKGQGVSAEHSGEKVQLGHGTWLNAPFTGPGVRIGSKMYPIAITEKLRDGASETIGNLQGRGLNVILLSGDREEKVRQVAKDLSVDSFLFERSPEEKLAFVEKLAGAGNKVLMVGDGLNDTAALAAAHASVAPSKALDAARAAADILFLRTSLRSFPELLDVSAQTVRLSKQNFNLATVYNIIAVPVAFAGLATPLIAAIAMSLSSITVLINGLRIGRRA